MASWSIDRQVHVHARQESLRWLRGQHHGQRERIHKESKLSREVHNQRPEWVLKNTLSAKMSVKHSANVQLFPQGKKVKWGHGSALALALACHNYTRTTQYNLLSARRLKKRPIWTFKELHVRTPETPVSSPILDLLLFLQYNITCLIWSLTIIIIDYRLDFRQRVTSWSICSHDVICWLKFDKFIFFHIFFPADFCSSALSLWPVEIALANYTLRKVDTFNGDIEWTQNTNTQRAPIILALCVCWLIHYRPDSAKTHK